ncbi:hypothetical protein Q8814_17465, partial [Rhodococcus sp. CC-R104]|nr:hypothetical protein [Rhodococcus sp. CC-R104]
DCHPDPDLHPDHDPVLATESEGRSEPGPDATVPPTSAVPPIVTGALPRRRDDTASQRPATADAAPETDTLERHEPADGGVVLAEAGPL